MTTLVRGDPTAAPTSPTESTAVLVLAAPHGEVRVFDLSADSRRPLLAAFDDDVELEDLGGARAGLLATALLRHLAVGAPAAPEQRDRLSGRELEVLALVAEGCLNREIAERLQLSHNSVKSYVRAAYRKIGVAHRAQAIRWCLDSPGTEVRGNHQERFYSLAKAMP